MRAVQQLFGKKLNGFHGQWSLDKDNKNTSAVNDKVSNQQGRDKKTDQHTIGFH